MNGDVKLLATYANYGYYVYLQDRAVVNGSVSNAQSGGIYLYSSSRVTGDVSIVGAMTGGVYMYTSATVQGNVTCSACQLDLQGNNTDIGGTTNVAQIGNTGNYSSYAGAKFGSLLVAPSGNTVIASNGQILLGNTTTVKGGMSATQAITIGSGLTITGNVSSGAAVSVGASSLVTGSMTATGSVTFANSVTVTGNLTTSSSLTAGVSTAVQGNVNASGSVSLGNSSAVTGSITAGSGVSLGTGSTVGQFLNGGNGTVTLTANNSIAGNVSCTGTCYLSMQGNDISIGGTTTVGHLYNWGSYRARFGGSITAHYAYIYIGYDAIVNGDVKLLATYANYGYYVYLQDRTVVNGTVSNTQTGGIYLYASTQVGGDVAITNTAAGGTGVSSNNIYMYVGAKVLGNVACSNCQLDIQGNNIDIGGTTSVGLIGNPQNYTSYSGAKFASLLSAPSGNTVNASNGQIFLGNTTTVKGGMYASQAITVANSLSVTGSVTAGGAISLGSSALVSGSLVSSGSITTTTSTTVQGSITAAGSVSLGNSAAITGSITAGSGVSLGTASTVGQFLSGGSGTVTLTANNSIAGNVSCTGTCYLSMQGNDISIGGTTTVGYLYNWGYYRARFGGTITASYAYIYIGYNAVVNGDVNLLATYANYGYYIYIQDGSVINGSVSNSQSGGTYLYSSSQVTGNVSTVGALAGNIYMYANAKIDGNVSCTHCQLDLQGNNTEVGGTTSVALIGNTGNYSSYTGAKFGSLLVAPSGNTVNATNGQILLGSNTTVKGGMYASQAITVINSLNVTGSVTAGGAISLGSSALVSGSLVSSSSITTTTSTTVQGSITAAGAVSLGNSAAITGSITAGSGVSLGTASTVGQFLSGGNGTVTLTANNSIAGNVSCTGTCYLNMQANDISIGGTTTVGYLYNWGYYRARFGGTITASYAYIYIGYNAVVNGDVNLLATYANYGYYIYIQDGSVVNGTVSNAQSGGVYHYANSTSQCTRTLTSGPITLYTGARPGGVCCGSAAFGSSCSSSCVSNSSGLTMPVGCQPPYGLNGSYYNTTDLTGAVALSRRDGPVDFDWGAGSPGTGVNADYFSVRWTGNVLVPYTGWYTFQTQSDDGVRLWVNGQQLINNWTLHGPTDDTSTTIYLKAGTRYPIEMNMYEWGGGAVARLRWKRPLDSAFAAIPYGNGTQGLYPDTVPVVPDAGVFSGAVWWSRANSFSGSDSAAMSTWANEADSSRNLTGSTTKPVYRNTNALNINFNPVVEFTSISGTVAGAQFFSAPSFLGTSTWQQAHYVMVGYVTSTPQNNWVYFEDAVDPGVGFDGRLSFHMGWTPGIVYWDAGASGNGNRTNYTDSTLVNNPSVWMFNMDAVATTPNGGKLGIRRDGVIKANSGSPNAFTGNNSNFRVGWPGMDSTLRGVLAEGMLFLGSSMSNAQAAQLETYLGLKYGSTLGGNGATTSSYQDSAATTTWAAASGFHHNIAGIGRDDKLLLDQRISRSVNTGQQITATSKATMPDGSSTVSAQDGAQLADRSFVIWGDNGLTSTSTVNIAAGGLAGRSRSMRLWRLQQTGTAAAQWTVCIPDAMLPSSFLTGNLADLQLNASTASDLSASPVSVVMSAGNCPGSGVGVTTSVPGRVATLSAAQLASLGSVSYFSVTRRLLDHLEITASSGNGVTCAPTTYTIKACADATCTSLYTGGVSGTLTLTGSGLTVNFPAGAGFTIPNGSSQVTVTAQVTTPGTATVGATGLSITPGNSQSVFCGLGASAAAANSCAMTVADAGFLLNVPHSRAGYSQTVTLSAVKKSDNSLACAPAFTGTQTVNVGCNYLNPTTGTKPLLVAGSAATNTSTNPSGTCNGSTGTRSLLFDSNGQTTLTVQYDDVGQLRLNASASGSGSSAGLSLSGSSSFVIAPFKTMSITGTPVASVAAGSPFAYTVTALNAAGQPTPNFGKETPPEGFVTNWVRNQPTGASAVDGVFSTGTAGSVSNGAVSYSAASWSEVGRLSVTARLASGNYLGSGFTSVASTASAWQCAVEGGTCTVPAGTTAAVSFDAGGANLFFKHGQSGNVPCTAAYFGDPKPGASKSCWIQIESGHYASQTGALSFQPHHFDVTTAAACGSFSYAAQPFTTTVTARNAQGAVTRNYDGSAGTSPNFAKTVNLSLASANATGSLTGSVAATSFLAGVGADMSTFSFTNKLTPEQTISLRATDTDGVSSSTFAEGSMVLRSGRLVLSNAFGSEKSPLQVPIQLQYWSGKSWVLNNADTCTVISPPRSCGRRP
ncbi:DUF6701 domain-containing protein [Ideonella paludis]|uniref:DUF6701 domain-containing protein n=1 Tax=Ideonella paludis TaxID=1233411 RepID=UPI003642C9B0